MRLIDADDLIDKWNKLLLKMIPTADGAHPVDFGIIISEISKQPTIEAAPVVHGEWIKETVLSKCSVCGFRLGADTYRYCPNCGAKMYGES